MGLTVYTVREGDLKGRIVSESYRHPGPDEPHQGERLNLGDGPNWRVISWQTGSPRATPDANTLVVEHAP